MTDDNRSQVPAVVDARAEFRRLERTIRDLPEAEVQTIRVDVPRAVSIVLGAVPRLEPYKATLQELPNFRYEWVGDLRGLAFAAWYTHLVTKTTTAPAGEKDPFTAKVPAARALRRKLLAHADMLVEVGVITAEQVADIRAGRGNVDLANDLVSLGALHDGVWMEIVGRTLLPRTDVDEAVRLGSEMLELLALRDGTVDDDGDTASLRDRATTLLLRAYDETRRGIAFLRHHEGDADAITPSVYALRSPRRADADASVAAAAS